MRYGLQSELSALKFRSFRSPVPELRREPAADFSRCVDIHSITTRVGADIPVVPYSLFLAGYGLTYRAITNTTSFSALSPLFMSLIDTFSE